VVGAVQELGSVLGPLLGAAVLAVADWRAIFWLDVVLGTLIAAVLALTGDRDARPRVRVLPAVLGLLALAAGLLTLVAPAFLTEDITLGIPFVPFAGASRLATPIGVCTLLLILAAVGTGPVASGAVLSVLRRVDLFGALCIAVALGSLILTFASADPQREVVGPLGWALAPLGLAAVAAYIWRHRTARDPLVPRGLMSARGGYGVVPSLSVSLLVGVALVAVVVDVPVLARLTVTGSQTTAALVLVRFLVAIPFGAFVGGWLLRWRAPSLVASCGLVLAGTGLVLMSRWGPDSLESWLSTPVLVLAGVGLGLALAPVNAAALAASHIDAHGLVSSLVVLARMVGMVVGLALLTGMGLHRYYAAVAALPNQLDTAALGAAGVVQVQTVFLGGSVAAFAAAGIALALKAPGARG
jgi:hypothetical protein